MRKLSLSLRQVRSGTWLMAATLLLLMTVPSLLRFWTDDRLRPASQLLMQQRIHAGWVRLYGLDAATSLAVPSLPVALLGVLLIGSLPFMVAIAAQPMTLELGTLSLGARFRRLSQILGRELARLALLVALSLTPVLLVAVFKGGERDVAWGLRSYAGVLMACAPYVALALVAATALQRRRWSRPLALVAALLLSAVCALARQHAGIWLLVPGLNDAALMTGSAGAVATSVTILGVETALGLFLAAWLSTRPRRTKRDSKAAPGRRSWFQRWVALATAGCVLVSSTHAAAYGANVHQRIMDLAWQSARAGVAPNLSQQVWPSGVPSGLTVPDFADPGDCALPASDPKNLCGEQVSPEQWGAYLERVRVTRQQVSGMKAGVPLGNCTDFGDVNTTLGDYPKAITPSHQNPRDESPVCRAFEDGKPTAGVYEKFAVPDDGAGNQGLVLGWHSLMRDNDSSDLSIDMLPVIPVPFPPFILPLGQILQVYSTVVEVVLAAIFIPFVCAYDWLFTDDEDCIETATRAADDVDPIDILKGVLPGIKHEEASKEVGLWHFINVRGDTSNWYDDLQGIYYDEAGPEGEPGGTDEAIMLLSDLLFMTLDASKSAGTERYEITEDETSLPNPSEDRAEWEWQSEPFAHIQYSPVDNFALYGHQRFKNSLFDTSNLGWVLHALGDVSVPMHVVGTTAWGHRPYEDAANLSLEEILFTKCTTGDNAAPTATNCGSNPSDDQLQLAQLGQALQVLQRAYRWDRFIEGHPDDVRELVTDFAKETWQLSKDGDLWCEPCSAGWMENSADGFIGTLKSSVTDAYTNEEDEEAYDNPEGYYTDDLTRSAALRMHVERAAAVSLAYLLHLTDDGNACVTPGRSFDHQCGQAGTSEPNCCGDAQCPTRSGEVTGECCRPQATGCYADEECCSNAVCGNDALCCATGNGRAGSGEACGQNLDCCSGFCLNDVCAGPVDWPCSNDSQCASGTCLNGKCTQREGEVNDPCTTGSECRGGICHDGKCGSRNGFPCEADTGCQSGDCEGGSCGRDNHSLCTEDSQCAMNVCDTGRCGIANTHSCNFDAECASLRCGDGSCCSGSGDECIIDAECCSGFCGTFGTCQSS